MQISLSDLVTVSRTDQKICWTYVGLGLYFFTAITIQIFSYKINDSLYSLIYPVIMSDLRYNKCLFFYPQQKSRKERLKFRSDTIEEAVSQTDFKLIYSKTW